MQKTNSLEDSLVVNENTKQKKKEYIDRKTKELLNFQYSIIAQLDEVIKKVNFHI